MPSCVASKRLNFNIAKHSSKFVLLTKVLNTLGLAS